jgi:hypothetical protein
MLLAGLLVALQLWLERLNCVGRDRHRLPGETRKRHDQVAKRRLVVTQFSESGVDLAGDGLFGVVYVDPHELRGPGECAHGIFVVPPTSH